MAVDKSKALLLKSLETSLKQRDVRAGFRTLDALPSPSLELSPAEPLDYDLLVLLAQWVDLGYRTAEFFERQLSAFKHPEVACAPASAYFRLKVAESFHLLTSQRPREASRLLTAILESGKPLLTPFLLFAVHFWKGRAHRQAGDFDQALAEIRQAREFAELLGSKQMGAVAKIHESWLVFHRGERKAAFDLLGEAEVVLLPTGHALSLGNISAARGRFLRQSGQYEKALQHFEEAICLYDSAYPDHPNLARALVNAAYVKRLIALEYRAKEGEKANAATHSKLLRITHDAMQLLRRAERIYAKYAYQPGTGSLLVNLGHLQLDSGNIDAAQEQAQLALAIGEDKQDPVLKARAYILQAYVQMAISDEGLDDGSRSLSPVQLATGCADLAIQLATGSQNRRLLAAAYITRGFTAADLSRPDWDCAASCAQKARELLGSQDHDHLTRELSTLTRRIEKSRDANAVIQSWISGEFRGKTFQEIEEEFASMVLPQAWKRLDRSVSRVAQELSMSPKKVRRILKKARLTE